MLARLVFFFASAVGAIKHNAASYGALNAGLRDVASLKEVIDGGQCVPGLGAKADAICDAAAAAVRSRSDGGSEDASAAKAAAAVCETLDGQLRACYAKQLKIIRDSALQRFRQGASADLCEAEYAGMVAAEREFTHLAEQSSRAEWSYDDVLEDLRATLMAIGGASGEWRDAVIKAAQTRANCFTVLKKLAFELDAATASRLGTDSPWNAGLAWRVPETNVNLSGSLQRGKSQLQVSHVPDDSANLLGPNGFNKPRVGAGDLAVSYKMDA